ncbi:MAG: FRG domain-containing protein [Gammaproteobacteria bacterium]
MSESALAAVDITTVSTLDELTDVVHETFQKTKSRWWFRGHPDSRWELIPKVWRGYDGTTERYLTNLFYQRAKLRHASFPDDNDYAAWLALMQHYGLPTRLLDWSDSALIAAYFAVKYERDVSGIAPDRKCAIWMLHPTELNASQGYARAFPSANAAEELIDILDFFEGLAYFHRHGLCDGESIWHFFASWLLPYVEASQPVIKYMARSDPSLLEELTRLASDLKRIESRRHPSGSTVHILAPANVRSFLEAEAT